MGDRDAAIPLTHECTLETTRETGLQVQQTRGNGLVTRGMRTIAQRMAWRGSLAIPYVQAQTGG